MQTTRMSFPILNLILAGTLLVSCKQQAPQPEASAEAPVAAVAETASQEGIGFRSEATGALFAGYLELKDALVASDAQAAAAAARRMQELPATAGSELEGTLSSLAASADLKEQRSLFADLGKALEPVLKNQISSGTVYKQFCPMAFDNQGGYWFSDAEAIRNPYFGDMMLKCGKVDLELKAL